MIEAPIDSNLEKRNLPILNFREKLSSIKIIKYNVPTKIKFSHSLKEEYNKLRLEAEI